MCTRFATLEERKNRIRDSCYRCLKDGHGIRECKSNKKCVYCNQFNRHHRSLCPKKYKQTTQEESQMSATEQINNISPMEQNEQNAMLSHGESVFMQTALTDIQNPTSNESVKTRILLDCGSQRTYITQSLADKLRLKKQYVEELHVFPFGSKDARVIKTHVTSINLKLRNGQKLCLKANIVPVISGSIHRKSLNKQVLKEFRDIAENLDLADTFPDKNETSQIELLIGNDHYLDIELQQKIEVQPGLYLMCSKLGWILTGRSYSELKEKEEPNMLILTHGSVNNSTINKGIFCGIDSCKNSIQDLEDFRNKEVIGICDKDKMNDDELSMRKFKSTLTFQDGRYSVTWPWKEENPDLPENKGLAIGRLKSCLKRLENKPDLLEKYNNVIKDQRSKGVIEKVQDSGKGKEYMHHYIPHHAVIMPQKSTTKLRIVNDASAKISPESKSLNECLFRGPVLLKDLCGLLMRFRLHRVAMVADIEKAFLQVGLQDSERDVTRFFWIKDTKRPSLFPNNIEIYRFCRVPFGIISSPFLLSATIEAHLNAYDTKLSEQLKHDIYVDNIITGASSDEQAVDLYKEAKSMFKDASMNLREWSSSSEKVNSLIPEVDRSTETETKVLGHVWDIKSDILSVKSVCSNINRSLVTKRIVLKGIASVFDPMGLVSPVILHGKMLLQEMWESGFDWDTKITDEHVLDKWSFISDQLRLLSDIKIRLSIVSQDKYVKYNLLCSCDASSKAYATAIYLQQENVTYVKSNLIFAKTRLAPVKKMTIPRLELMAVLIGVRCLKFVKTQLMIEISHEYLWTDSQVALDWINSKKQLPVFVKNRVKEIKNNNCVIIAHVDTKDNPADGATRGSSVSDLKDNSF
ncbi:uncharacterized protein LOC132760172 [Ruditapes philippinarum]|uniref:uncharacterized protein LOC132760172 n=1 Tax=Ruditapes philippinarum TaxID=129788 RepID=UPI00295BE8D2|nr:uncharacterized protein LOC132760172 [Ruditapes philippinarum]